MMTSGRLVCRYDLDLYLSLLKSVTQTGKDGISAPPAQFTLTTRFDPSEAKVIPIEGETEGKQPIRIRLRIFPVPEPVSDAFLRFPNVGSRHSGMPVKTGLHGLSLMLMENMKTTEGKHPEVSETSDSDTANYHISVFLQMIRF